MLLEFCGSGDGPLVSYRRSRLRVASMPRRFWGRRRRIARRLRNCWGLFFITIRGKSWRASKVTPCCRAMGRELFHPIRLALAGRAGEGELDRVILLLDEGAGASFAVRVKSARERILEFCSALD